MTQPTSVSVSSVTTVYQYKLIHKITYPPGLIYGYILLLLFLPILDLMMWPIFSLVYYGAGALFGRTIMISRIITRNL